MSLTDDPHTWTGALVRNPQGEVLGHVNGVYFHDVTGRATWAAVSDGAGVAMVPLDQAEIDEHGLRLPYRVEQLVAAPRTAPGAHLDPQTEQELYRHYGFTPPASTGTATPRDTATPPPDDLRRDQPRSGPVEMVLSREEMRTGIERRAYRRLRLVTYIVTEDVTFTVPVSRQEVRLEEIPLHETDGSAVGSAGAELAEDVHEVVLRGEQVQFTKTTVPVERVQLVRRVVAGRESVSAQLRSEQIDVDHTGVRADADTSARGTARPNR